MRGWGAPLVASAFWAGLLLWDLRPAAATTWPWWLWVVLGGFARAGAVATAPGRRSEAPVRGAGLADADAPAVAAVTSTPADPSPSPLRGVALLVLGGVLGGRGWAGFGGPRAEGPLPRPPP